MNKKFDILVSMKNLELELGLKNPPKNDLEHYTNMRKLCEAQIESLVQNLESRQELLKWINGHLETLQG